MLEKYEWIADEKQYFGQANTAYDFEANDPKEAAKQLNRLNETKEKLSKSVNMRAMNMLGKAEEKVKPDFHCAKYTTALCKAFDSAEIFFIEIQSIDI